MTVFFFFGKNFFLLKKVFSLLQKIFFLLQKKTSQKYCKIRKLHNLTGKKPFRHGRKVNIARSTLAIIPAYLLG